MVRFVWYACYGSNLCLGRFMAYIAGHSEGVVEHSESGCRDASPPRDTAVLVLNHELYFARHSPRWGGAPAFIAPTPTPQRPATLLRLYLVTEEQFDDIVSQENLWRVGASHAAHRRSAVERGCSVMRDSFYGTIVHLGDAPPSPAARATLPPETAIDGTFPIFTFTYKERQKDVGVPALEYVATIARGLGELGGLRALVRRDNGTFEEQGTFGALSMDEIADYFVAKDGVAGALTLTEIAKLLALQTPFAGCHIQGSNRENLLS